MAFDAFKSLLFVQDGSVRNKYIYVATVKWVII